MKKPDILQFDRDKFDPAVDKITRIGSGSLGGKASSLVQIKDVLENSPLLNNFEGIEIDITFMTVMGTDVFDRFMTMNNLFEVAYSDVSDELILSEFQKASLPPELIGDLRAFITKVNVPLAVRSSSLLEDSLKEPFAGIYGTKKLPNNQVDLNTRFKKLTEAIKFVYSSTFLKEAKDYFKATNHDIRDEKMAVIIQEVVGKRFKNRFYPVISGVARSYNFYPFGKAKAEDGVVNLALGLGKTIVDGGVTWNYCPAYPKAPPPFGDVKQIINLTQKDFWAVNMGKIPVYDPVNEIEYLIKGTISDAENDKNLDMIASTYDSGSDRLIPGIGNPGARVLNFAPILNLNLIKLNDFIKRLMKVCVDEVGKPVEIEFAINFDKKDEKSGINKNRVRFGFLQVRPMFVSDESIEITEEEINSNDCIVYTKHALGNSSVNNIHDIVFVKPEVFEAKNTKLIAAEIEEINKKLVESKTPYLLIGFGRWGSSDPWLGIPVNLGQIAGAKVIVESVLEGMNVEMSQGSHFFHNLISFGVLYFSVKSLTGKNDKKEFTDGINWEILNADESKLKEEGSIEEETQFIKHIRFNSPLKIKADGKTGKGIIVKMSEKESTLDKILSALQERAKELNCLYKIEELLNNHSLDVDFIFREVVKAIPPGFQYPDVCTVKLIIEDKIYTSPNFKESQWEIKTDILVQDTNVGQLTVYYTERKPISAEGPFLKEERKLINTIAERISGYLLHNRLKQLFDDYKTTGENISAKETKKEWMIALDLLKRTDVNLYKVISRKMLNFLCCRGVEEAENLLPKTSRDEKGEEDSADENIPIIRTKPLDVSNEIFKIAPTYLTDSEILFRIQKWIQEDKANILVRVLEDNSSTLDEISEALRRFELIIPESDQLSDSVEKGIKASLTRRLLSDQLDLINIAKDFVKIHDFARLINKMIYPQRSQGKIGGKGMGLYIAHKILRKASADNELLKNIRTPKSWYIASDALMEFLHYNNLEEVIEQKYKSKDQIRQEYPAIIQLFKNSNFRPEIMKQLAGALEVFGDSPLIVRSSSLLEDRLGSAFSGKYKSLFLANQGSKVKRLDALLDAIAEVYSSIFSPDPIEYRAEKGLLDYQEEMGVLIQQVIGTKVGKYFFPVFAGVAFSNNEFRWSPRIKRDDGLIRLVPGLGTRAVDRVGDDYPVLIAPGKPSLRVNITAEDIVRYSPQKIDVINLETNTFETHEIKDLLREIGDNYPSMNQVFSKIEHDHIKDLSGLEFDTDPDSLVVTFNRLISGTDFIPRMQAILNELKDKMKTPVDIEFASDGKQFYLLQCRPQSFSEESAPAEIPRDIPKDRIVFNANKFISNGRVPDITHIVYVDPEEYGKLSELAYLKTIGCVVGKLNKILPKRKFILIGPGRWGSRGDIKLGVNVTYSDINNTAVLIEVAKKKGNYSPDLSFGTHFFQDLVEAQIRYLPLYPDEPGIIFNEEFLKYSHNILSDVLPEYYYLSNVIKVIDVVKSSYGRVLRILMNADIEEAVGILVPPSAGNEDFIYDKADTSIKKEESWMWRMRMAERIAASLDAEKFGVKALYITGSTVSATARPDSDINMLVHFEGNDIQKGKLTEWFNGWSLALSEMNFLKTGYKTNGLLSITFVTEEDIKNKKGLAAKIGAVTDPAKKLNLKK